MKREDLEVVKGPAVDSLGGVIYQVTLASGMIVTTPGAFGTRPEIHTPETPIITEDGRVLSLPHRPITPGEQTASR